MNTRSLLAGVALSAAAVSLLAGCTSSGTTASTATPTAPTSSASTPTRSQAPTPSSTPTRGAAPGTGSSTPSKPNGASGSTPKPVNTPASPQEAAAAAKNDNKCVNGVAWMTFDNGTPATRTLAGSCDSVIVFGDKGHLTLDKAGTITVMGDGNTVTASTVGKVDFEGTGNTITYRGTTPQILEQGKNNTLTAH